MKVAFPFSSITAEQKFEFLLEKGFTPHFSLKQKVYYNYLRAVLPIPLRQKIQKLFNKDVPYLENFIDDKLVKLFSQDEINNFAESFYGVDMRSAIVLTHDVEEQHGFDFIPKVIELEEKYGFKSSWNIVPYKYKIDPGIINLIQNSGNEVGIHGYNHDGRLYFSEKIFRHRAKYINEALKKYNAVGFRSPMVHRNLQWLQMLDIEYDASCFDYDAFQPFPGGTGSLWPFTVEKFVELPYTLPQDHVLFYVLHQKDISIWKKKSEWIYQKRGVILALTHPDYLIPQKHFELYEQLLVHFASFPNALRLLPRALADKWEKYSQELIASD